MLARRRTHRFRIRTALLVAMLVTAPMAFASAIDDQETSTTSKPKANRQTAGAAPIVAGRITSDSGDPLAGVLVKIAIPASDMRFVFPGSGHKTLEAKTDEDGQYKIELPKDANTTKVSVDAMKPGYRTLAGTLMAGGENREVEVKPGVVAQASFELKPALYLKAHVVDENGEPISDAQIHAGTAFARSSGGIQITASVADGSFEIFNYPVEPFAERNDKSKGLIHIEHHHYLPQRVDDVYALLPEQRDGLRIVLRTGRKVWGTVLDDKGRPAANAMVETLNAKGGREKAVLTGANGRFVLRGLTDGAATLRAHAKNLRQKVKMPITLDRDHNNLELRLQPIALASQPQSIEVLGMTLADVTPELQSVYDLFHPKGALILDPGKDFARLHIGDLAEGYCFWMAGDRKIGSVRQFVEQVLAETAAKNAEEYRCRIVYSFSTVDFVGTNTQYLKLTNDDVTELRKVLTRLTAD